ncbi:MAG: HD domain-containing phosphohydrolase [Vampirovibrionales bacterium]|nr:HD domain-containing phosphohydrolase [Vampirovibrionales bacterium]
MTLPESRPESSFDKAPASSDALTALYALNWGEFMGENFMSPELLAKVSHKAAADPERLRRQLRELVDLYALEQTLAVLGYNPDAGHVIYDTIAATLRSVFGTDGCFVLHLSAHNAPESLPAQEQDDNDATLTLKLLGCALTEGINRPEALHQVPWHLPETHPLCSTLLRGLPQVVTACNGRAQAEAWQQVPVLADWPVRAYLAYPLRDANHLSGLILWANRQSAEFSLEFQQLAQASAELVSAALGLQRQIGEAQQLIAQPVPDYAHMLSMRADLTDRIGELAIRQQTFLNDLSLAVDSRHDYTRGHSQKTAHVARVLSEALGLNEKTADLVYYGALLANLGRVQAPEHLLGKTSTLTPGEWQALQDMPSAGIGMLMHIHTLGDVVPYVRYMRERWDGFGLPEGLMGNNIPLGSRILALADAYVSMTEQRPYREQPMAHADALKTLSAEAGQKWDPMLVNMLAQQPANELLI